jgi:hypothetical protein
MISVFLCGENFASQQQQKKGVANGYKDFLWKKWAHVTTAISRQKV